MDINSIDINKVQYRPLQESDFDALIKIGRSSLKDILEKHPEAVGNDVIAYDFADSVKNSNYSEVAVYQGEPIAVLLGRNNKMAYQKNGSLSQRFKGSHNKLNLILQKEGLNMFLNMLNFAHYDNILLNRSEKTYDGELVYFNQLPELYQTDIGYTLLDHFRNHLKLYKANNFYFIVHSDKKEEYFSNNLFKLVNKINMDKPNEDISISLYEYDIN